MISGFKLKPFRSRLFFLFSIPLIFLLKACSSSTTAVTPTRIEDRSVNFYNTSASIEVLQKRNSRLLIDFEYNEVSGSDSENRTFDYGSNSIDEEPLIDEVSAKHQLNVQSYRAGFSFNVVDRRRINLTVTPGVQYSRLERLTEVDNTLFPEVQKNTWVGVKLSLASQLNDYFTVKGFGSVHLKSQEAGLLFAFHALDWLDLELGWRVLDYDEAIFDHDTNYARCPQNERIDRVRCAYDEAEIEAVFNGFSGGLHFKF